MFNIKIHAYCLMDNLYHLLLSTPDANLSRAMRHINGIYTQRYNRDRNTDGSLFRGRYKAQLVEEDHNQLIVSRYIHLNPVKAKMVSNTSDYKWSSYRAYLGLDKMPPWLSPDDILRQVPGRNILSRIENYKDFVERKECAEINSLSSAGLTTSIIGSESFREKILSQIDDLSVQACRPDINRSNPVYKIDSIIKKICEFYDIERESLMHTKRGQLNWPRLVCIYMCRKYFGYSLKAISHFFDSICYITVSTTISRCEQRLKENNLTEEIKLIYEMIRAEMLQRDT